MLYTYIKKCLSGTLVNTATIIKTAKNRKIMKRRTLIAGGTSAIMGLTAGCIGGQGNIEEDLEENFLFQDAYLNSTGELVVEVNPDNRVYGADGGKDKAGVIEVHHDGKIVDGTGRPKEGTESYVFEASDEGTYRIIAIAIEKWDIGAHKNTLELSVGGDSVEILNKTIDVYPDWF